MTEKYDALLLFFMVIPAAITFFISISLYSPGLSNSMLSLLWATIASGCGGILLLIIKDIL
jgi:hypothetical protein